MWAYVKKMVIIIFEIEIENFVEIEILIFCKIFPENKLTKYRIML